MEEKSISTLGSALLSTLAYFSIFKHPLKLQELGSNCHYAKATKAEIQEEMNLLLEAGIVEKTNNYYFLKGEKNTIKRREAGESLAPVYMERAKSYSKLISKFPFVRAVFISGSLSKGYMDENSDIDYFIITEPNRLWLCRTLLVLFKKIFLYNSHKHFCVNYFIDSDNLLIPDQNLFTATELVFILPMYNSHLYTKFRKANHWTYWYYPNLNNESREVVHAFGESKSRIILEKMFSGQLGEWMDICCFRKTVRYWKKKFSDFDESAFEMELRSKKNVSKHHPQGFQQKILSIYKSKLNQIENEHRFILNFNEPELQKKEEVF